MDFKITSAEGEELKWMPELPSELQVLRLRAANLFCSSGDFGNIVFQNISLPGIDLWYRTYLIKKKSLFHCSSQKQVLGLHAMLRNQWEGAVEGLQEVRIRPHQFNLTYLPNVNFHVTFEPGQYSSLSIHYQPESLRNYLPLYPSLKGFLDKIRNASATRLFETHHYITPEIMEVIHQVLHSPYPDEIQQAYLRIKADELLFLALSEITNHKKRNKPVLSRQDIDRIYEALDWLEAHVDDPRTLHQIAKEVGLNEFKLKKGFRTILGMSVFDYVLKLRLEKAKMLLLETDKPIREIAFLAGYNNQSSFTAAFTKQFGYSPMIVRRKGK